MKFLEKPVGSLAPWIQARLRDNRIWSIQDKAGAPHIIVFADTRTLPQMAKWVHLQTGAIAGIGRQGFELTIVWCDHNVGNGSQPVHKAIDVIDDGAGNVRSGLGGLIGRVYLYDQRLFLQFAGDISGANAAESIENLHAALNFVHREWPNFGTAPVLNVPRAVDPDWLARFDKMLPVAEEPASRRDWKSLFGHRGPEAVKENLAQNVLPVTDLELRSEIKGMVEGKLLQPLLRFFQFRPIHIVGNQLLITRSGDREAVRTNKFLAPKEANGQLAFVFSAALRVHSSAAPSVQFAEFFGDPKPVMAGAVALHAPTLTRKMFLPPNSEVVELLAWLSAPMPALAIDQQKLQSFVSAVANELGSRSLVE